MCLTRIKYVLNMRGTKHMFDRYGVFFTMYLSTILGFFKTLVNKRFVKYLVAFVYKN